MKKPLLLLLSLLCAGLWGCHKGGSPGDPLADYFAVYDGVTAHQHVAMDPFLIAFRYHLYLKGGSTAGLKAELFPTAEITASADGQSATLVFTEPAAQPTGDLVRSGKVVLHTYGASLDDEGALWQVTADAPQADQGYRVYYPGADYYYIAIDPGEYTIANAGAGRYRVQAQSIYMSLYYQGVAWSWGLDMAVTHTQQGAGLGGSRFEIEAGIAPCAGWGMSVASSARYRYDILEKVLYNTSCGLLVKSAGMERIVRTDMKDYKGLDSLLLDRGRQYDNCAPGFSFAVRMEADSVWTTHRYGPDRTWLDR